MRAQFTIVKDGMGGFLNPPGDAEHTYSLRDGYGKNAGYSSLRYALACGYVPDAVKNRITAVLAKNPPQFTPEWEKQVYRHFKGCYSPDGVERRGDRMVTSGPPEHSLAFLHIREFFPEAKPNMELL